jgi:Ca-activated chloride channel family protein
MQKRVTMHLRNNRLLFVVVAILFFNLSIWAQTSGAQNSGSAQPVAAPQSNQPSAPAQSTSPQPTSPPPSSTQPAPAQPSSTQTAPSQPGQAQPEQGPPPASGQGSNPQAGGFVFHTRAQEVVLHATVIDDKQHMITNLDKTAFTVFEDGKPQTITSFRHEDIPVALGIVIDNSGSMREKRDRVNAAALNLVRASNPGDQVFIVNFNDEYYLDQDYTSEINKLKEALEKVEARGGTALYDALVASADHLKKSAKLQKKVLLVVTDGEDNASRESLEQAVRRLSEENGPTVYAIGILGEEKARRARRALQTLAERTGGIAFLPKTADEVDSISRTVAHDIRNQYTIGYRPTTPQTVTGYRAIHVDARARGYGRLTVRTRSGYYAGQEQASGGGN